ncbi:MAG: 5-(carboxyamino)imidazole ribonucleotide mutase [Anaplasmataceae bacterium]|nr:5-(carboxyamino)imidazole ribonucleotide mutase [Anaplasmataceae bacterium]
MDDISTIKDYFKVAIVMGSNSDYVIMKEAEDILSNFDITFQSLIVSAHRTPMRLFNFNEQVNKHSIEIIIAGAGGAAHLPGMLASVVDIPVLGVPINSTDLNGMDSLLSIAQMPSGVPVGTFSIGKSGARNAAIFAAKILSLNNEILKDKIYDYRQNLANSIKYMPKD